MFKMLSCKNLSLALLSFGAAVYLLIYSYKTSNSFIYSYNGSHDLVSINNETKAFLVWSSECRIPNSDPFNKEAMMLFEKQEYLSCNEHALLSYINVSDNRAFLHINKEVLPSYTKKPVYCCYSNVSRHVTRRRPDRGIKFSKCSPIENFQQLIDDTVRISCRTNRRKIYENVHAAITVREEFRVFWNEWKNGKPPSILFIGIDSVSRLNLIRAMPKTNDFLVNSKDTWLPLYGYNKIDENTFPNLMAIFTGYNETEVFNICNPKTSGPLDSCRFIWKDYKKFGYVTAYAEDQTSLSTFNYLKKGFIKEPVDYYFRPYMEAAESLGTVYVDRLNYCAGPETSGERIMNLAENFATTYKDYPTFGIFWMNTFSHSESISTVSKMDEKVLKLLEDITNGGILDNSIVIFLSDHGMRYGKIRYTFTGWLEDRLPFIFISFPNWFKEKYPDEIKNFQSNANRLTSPYDLHITLQHILVLSGFNYTMKQIDTCPSCQSFFTKIPQNRSCESSGIAPYWCTCGGYSKLDQKKEIVAKAANFLLEELQKFINKKGGSKKCAQYHLGKILASYISKQFTYKKDTYLLISIETIPKAVFESTLHLITDARNNTMFSIESSISRLDSYAQHGKCVEDERLKQYCFCK